jgi:hypothetical protein
MFGEEPGKQKTRSCRTQELARGRAKENARRKKEPCRIQWESCQRPEHRSEVKVKMRSEGTCPF